MLVLPGVLKRAVSGGILVGVPTDLILEGLKMTQESRNM
jgi:hypothetical protein